MGVVVPTVRKREDYVANFAAITVLCMCARNLL